MPDHRTYIAIDLKSFYASVECCQRGLDPLDTNLVVADETRSDKTICLAVSPALKSHGIPGRERLFVVKDRVRQVNRERERAIGRPLGAKSVSDRALRSDPMLAVDYVVAPPHMALYMETSARIYNIYLDFVAPEDIHVYSIDEVFIDVTDYLGPMGISAKELAMRMIRKILEKTGITATAGIGTNLYLAKIAMDIMAKHVKADKDGVRIAELDELSYRRQLWEHEPITDFWRIGHGYASKLAGHGMRTMGDVALRSLEDEELLYRLFGVNAELLIDHAWGWEPCTMADIKAYRPSSTSLSQGQVLMEPYSFHKARLVLGEMAEALALSLCAKDLMCDQVVIVIGYDVDSVSSGRYGGPLKEDWYGRRMPPPAHGSLRLDRPTDLASRIKAAAWSIYDRTVDPRLHVRRLNITAGNVMSRGEAAGRKLWRQMDLFSDHEAEQKMDEEDELVRQKEERLQKAALSIKERFGKNAILKLSSYEDGATARERNRQIGGHKA